MSKRTPGSFYHCAITNNLCRRERDHPIAQFMWELPPIEETGTPQEARDEIIDLLNKGTHFDGMLEALKALLAKHIEVCEQEFCTGPHNKGWSEDEEPIRSALAAIAACEEDAS